ncbi:hypothetical protein BC828DRAFT_393626 [Blastocladiella britannica]|nr:hypothetical protein BC828DRAFT_393626 [Blastocladiella britannica]
MLAAPAPSSAAASPYQHPLQAQYQQQQQLPQTQTYMPPSPFQPSLQPTLSLPPLDLSGFPAGTLPPPAYREKVQKLRTLLLDRRTWRMCRGTPAATHKVPPSHFDAGEVVCRTCKQADPKIFVDPEAADVRIKQLLALEPCHFVPRYDQPGCGVDKDRAGYESKDWHTWALKPQSRGTVLRERLWQCCLGGGKKAAAKYRAGQARNTSKIGCPRSLYAVTRWDPAELKARVVEVYFKHKHLPECSEHGSVGTRA